MTTKPKVSVLMSVYNGELYLREAMESVLRQTFTDFEFLIVDDGSEDATWRILQNYAARDHRIVLLRNEENVGLTKSLNRGLHVARGEYVARQDADDLSLPSRLSKQVAVLDTHSDIVLVSGNLDLIDADGHVWRRPRRMAPPGLVAWYLMFFNYLGGHSQVMFRRQVVLDLGSYSEDCPYSQDYELWLRLSDVGKIVILPEVLLLYRTHSKGVTFCHGDEQKRYSLWNTQRAMERLLGEEVPVAEVAALRAFWSGPSADSHIMGLIDRRLQQLYHAFLADRARRGLTEPGLAWLLGRQIAQRFLIYARVLARSGRLFPALHAVRFALAWQAQGFVHKGTLRP